MSEYPLINSAYVTYADVSCSVEVHEGESIQTRDFSAIDYSDAVEIVAVQGTGSVKLGDAIGVYSSEASVTMYRGAFLRLQEALEAKSPGALARATFDLVVSYADPATGSTVTDSLLGCRIKGREKGLAAGSEAIAVTVPLSVSLVLINGKRLV